MKRWLWVKRNLNPHHLILWIPETQAVLLVPSRKTNISPTKRHMWVDDFPRFFKVGSRYPFSPNRIIFHWTVERWEKNCDPFFFQRMIPSRKLTYHIPLKNGIFESMIFRTSPFGGICIHSLEGNPNIWTHDQPMGFLACSLQAGNRQW